MKKIILIMIGFLAAVIAAVAVILLQPKSKTLTSMTKGDVAGITITDGSNGNITEIKGEDAGKLFDIISSVKTEKADSSESTGWLYNIEISGKDSSESIELVSEETCVISKDRFSIDKKKGEEIVALIKELCE